MNNAMRNASKPLSMTKQMYLEHELHRVVRERDNYRAWSWLWFCGCVVASAFAIYGILHT